jgi:putative endonuclease
MTSEEQIVYELAHIAQKKAVRQRRRRLARPRSGRADPHAVKLSPTQQRGRRAEDLARQHLQAAGLIVLGQNLRCNAGEIDLVCKDGTILVFIEVRHRRSGRYGGAAASVNREKQQRLIRAAGYFLASLSRQYFNGATPACRFDVIAVEPDGLVWLAQAFTAG